ncbi:MAG TPA: hypothetical protein VFL54_06765 [Gammaproteobacteria bacterium]|nr:hypothetical protein [Gammaproteobacteria bacterium]
MSIEISAAAALEVSALQRRGYRGVALLSDPLTGQLALFRAHATGCDCLAACPVLQPGAPAGVTELPDLMIELDATPAEAFKAAAAEIKRLTGLLLN